MGEARRETSQRELIYYTGSNFAEIKAAWDEYYKWAAYPPALVDRGTHLMIEGGGMPPTRVDAGWAIAKKPLEWYREPMYSPAALETYFAQGSSLQVQQTTVSVPILAVNDTINVTVTWTNTFADTNYSVIPVPVGAGGLIGVSLVSKAPKSCVLAVRAFLKLTVSGSVQVTGIHP